MRSFLLSAGVLVGLAAAGRADDPKPLMVTKVFSVADLVTPIPDFALPGGNPPAPAERFHEATPADHAARLVRQVTALVRPHSWQVGGGDGTVQYFDLGSALVVKNSPAVVAEVADLLAGLRKLHDTSVSTEVRVLSVPAGFCKRVGLTPADGSPSVLSDREVRLLLETAQGNRSIDVMQFPKLTTFDGQAATVRVDEEEAGDAVTLCGRVSADGRFVSLKVHVARGGKSAEAAVVVPDGGTMVVGGWTEKGGMVESGPPVLSHVPYLNRLFRNVGIAPDREVIVLATPRVIVSAEEDAVEVAPMPREVAAVEEVTVQMLVAEVSGGFARAAGLEPAAGAWVLPAGGNNTLDLVVREEMRRDRLALLSRPTMRVVAGQAGVVSVGQDGGPGVWARVTPRVAPAGDFLLRVETQVMTAAANGTKNVETADTASRVPAGGTLILRGASRTQAGGTVVTLFILTPHRTASTHPTTHRPFPRSCRRVRMVHVPPRHDPFPTRGPPCPSPPSAHAAPPA